MASLGGSAPGVVDGILSLPDEEDPYASALYDHRRSTILAARDTVTPVTPLPVPPPPATPFPPHPPSTTLNDPPLVVPPPAPPSPSQREIPSQSQRVPIFSPVPTPAPRATPPVSPSHHTPTFSPSPSPSPPMAISPPLPKVSSPIPPLSPAPPASTLQREPQADPPCRSQRAQACDPIDVGPQQEVLRPHRNIGTPLR